MLDDDRRLPVTGSWFVDAKFESWRERTPEVYDRSLCRCSRMYHDIILFQDGRPVDQIRLRWEVVERIAGLLSTLPKVCFEHGGRIVRAEVRDGKVEYELMGWDDGA